MILEAAKRATGTASPIPYINKILSDWKHAGVSTVESIPTSAPSSPRAVSGISAAIESANAKSDRERHYALKREKAQSVAERFLRKANSNEEYKSISTELSKMEISLAKAEVFEPQKLPELEKRKSELLKRRAKVLKEMGIVESQLQPQYECKKCSDTGFLPSGAACNCYVKD
jgi:hypothetical protein